MTLPAIGHAVDRLDLRVKGKGHFVDLNSIRYNFEHSFANFKKIASQFNKVMLLDGGIGSNQRTNPTILAIYNNRELIRQQANPSMENAVCIAELAYAFGQEPGISHPRMPKR